MGADLPHRSRDELQLSLDGWKGLLDPMEGALNQLQLESAAEED